MQKASLTPLRATNELGGGGSSRRGFFVVLLQLGLALAWQQFLAI
jgi:hypothetical protein